MNAETAKATAEAEMRALMDNWLEKVHAHDVPGLVSHYAPDILAVDAVSQLQLKGVDAYRKHWQACLSLCPGPMISEIHDLHIAAGYDMAFGHGLSRCGGTGGAGCF